MKTIQKRANELKPGDVIPGDGNSFGNCIAVKVFFSADPHDKRIVVDAFSITRQSIDRYWLDPNTELPIEAPALTPAQEHAERLLGMLREVQEDVRNKIMPDCDAIDILLARIDPPKAPTLEEALAMLAKMCGSNKPETYKEAWSLLDRARRAQVLPS